MSKQINFNPITDTQRILFLESYVKELKKALEQEKQSKILAVKNLESLVREFKSIDLHPNVTKLISYKEELKLTRKANTTKKKDLEKFKKRVSNVEHHNYLLKAENQRLKAQLEKMKTW